MALRNLLARWSWLTISRSWSVGFAIMAYMSRRTQKSRAKPGMDCFFKVVGPGHQVDEKVRPIILLAIRGRRVRLVACSCTSAHSSAALTLRAPLLEMMTVWQRPTRVIMPTDPRRLKQTNQEESCTMFEGLARVGASCSSKEQTHSHTAILSRTTHEHVVVGGLLVVHHNDGLFCARSPITQRARGPATYRMVDVLDTSARNPCNECRDEHGSPSARLLKPCSWRPFREGYLRLRSTVIDTLPSDPSFSRVCS